MRNGNYEFNYSAHLNAKIAVARKEMQARHRDCGACNINNAVGSGITCVLWKIQPVKNSLITTQ